MCNCNLKIILSFLSVFSLIFKGMWYMYVNCYTNFNNRSNSLASCCFIILQEVRLILHHKCIRGKNSYTKVNIETYTLP